MPTRKVSLKELEAWTGVSVRVLSDWRSKKKLDETGLQEAVRGIVALHREETKKARENNYNADAKLRLIEAQAEERELKVAQMRGDFIPVDEIEKEWGNAILKAKARLLQIPRKLAPQLQGEPEIEAIESLITEAIHDALRELSS
jgi:phage terminase Nu1 subunit (DNA packaging protein)